jgi:hypothetical protein
MSSLAMLCMLSTRTNFDAGHAALQAVTQAAAPQLLPEQVAPQTAIAVLQVR